MVRRTGPAHPIPLFRDGRPAIILLTVCARRRSPILATPQAQRTLLKAWRKAQAWSVGRYVLMPDHLHLFCAPRDPTVPLTNWIRYWKSLASRAWPGPKTGPIWQEDFWDRQLRDGENYLNKWEYVRSNPVRAGLVRKPEDWPYSGEINTLDWA